MRKGAQRGITDLDGSRDFADGSFGYCVCDLGVCIFWCVVFVQSCSLECVVGFKRRMNKNV
jgi:hypothetical protein